VSCLSFALGLVVVSGAMAFDLGAILQLPEVLRSTLKTAHSLGRVLPLQELPIFCVALIGPVDGGKTALVRALLKTAGGDIPALAERPGHDTIVPVEYVFGSRTRLLLGLGGSESAPQRWVEAKRDDAKAITGRDVRCIRVEISSSILSDWNVRLVDYPSIEGAAELMHERFSALSHSDTGVLYVVPGRGLTDTDTQALELLRRQRVAVVESIREEELLPTRSLLELVELPGFTCPFVVPLVAFRTRNAERNQGHNEQELLRKCFALLRADAMVSGKIGRYVKNVRRIRSDVRSEVAARLAALHAVRGVSDPLAQLHALASALTLERDAGLLEPLDRSLTDLMASLEQSHAVTPGTRRNLLRKDVSALIDQYNVEAGNRSVARSPSSKDRVMDFGARYVEGREELTGFLKNILNNDELELTEAERESLGVLVRGVGDDRIEVALLGRFSSGKSSLINALLGVPVDDRVPKLLPTSVRPETATVNRLEYADGTVLRKVSWLDRASLTFLSETTERGQLRVHVDEIKAFYAWIRSGAVSPRQCSFDLMGHDEGPVTRLILRGRAQPDPMQTFEALWRELGFPDRAPRFVYSPADWRTPKLPDGTYPARVEIRSFEHSASGWPKAPTLRQAFDAVKEDPAVALRVGCLHVGFDHPLLQHASIIDTPGTDAPIPHHRKVAREIIRDKGCPVLYCFLGTRAGGREDQENLRLLKEWGIGKTNLKRFFFVITMKGQVSEADHAEVRAAVKGSLRDVGIPAEQLYFTEVVKEQNDDFQALKNDVSQFVAQSREPLFASWIASARRVLGDVHGRYEKRLIAMAEDEKSRAARALRLQNDASVLSIINAEFESSTQWGVAWASSRVKSVINTKAAEINGLIKGLTTRESFEGIKDALSPAVEDINEAAKKIVRAVSEGTTGKLQSLLAERLPGRSLVVRPLVLEDDFFQSAGVLEAVDRIEWRGFFKKVWQIFSKDWNKDVAVNRERIASPWDTAQKTGAAEVDAQVAVTVEHLRRELCRISQGIKSELDQCLQREMPEHAETLRKRRKNASTWLRRFDALERKFQGKAKL
jgi:Dynamin family